MSAYDVNYMTGEIVNEDLHDLVCFGCRWEKRINSKLCEEPLNIASTLGEKCPFSSFLPETCLIPLPAMENDASPPPHCQSGKGGRGGMWVRWLRAHLWEVEAE